MLDVSAELEYQSTHSAIRSGTDDARDCASDSTVASLRVLRCEELLIPSALRVGLNILVPHENTHVRRLICCPNTSSFVKNRGVCAVVSHSHSHSHSLFLSVFLSLIFLLKAVAWQQQ